MVICQKKAQKLPPLVRWSSSLLLMGVYFALGAIYVIPGLAIFRLAANTGVAEATVTVGFGLRALSRLVMGNLTRVFFKTKKIAIGYACVAIILTLSTASIPWINYIYVLLAMFSCHGLCFAYVKNTSRMFLRKVWSQRFPKFIKVRNYHFLAGAIVGPFLFFNTEKPMVPETGYLLCTFTKTRIGNESNLEVSCQKDNETCYDGYTPELMDNNVTTTPLPTTTAATALSDNFTIDTYTQCSKILTPDDSFWGSLTAFESQYLLAGWIALMTGVVAAIAFYHYEKAVRMMLREEKKNAKAAGKGQAGKKKKKPLKGKDGTGKSGNIEDLKGSAMGQVAAGLADIAGGKKGGKGNPGGGKSGSTGDGSKITDPASKSQSGKDSEADKTSTGSKDSDATNAASKTSSEDSGEVKPNSGNTSKDSDSTHNKSPSNKDAEAAHDPDSSDDDDDDDDDEDPLDDPFQIILAIFMSIIMAFSAVITYTNYIATYLMTLGSEGMELSLITAMFTTCVGIGCLVVVSLYKKFKMYQVLFVFSFLATTAMTFQCVYGHHYYVCWALTAVFGLFAGKIQEGVEDLADDYDILSDEFEGMMDKGESLVLAIISTSMGYLMAWEPKTLFYVTVFAFAVCTLFFLYAPKVIKWVKRKGRKGGGKKRRKSDSDLYELIRDESEMYEENNPSLVRSKSTGNLKRDRQGRLKENED